LLIHLQTLPIGGYDRGHRCILIENLRRLLKGFRKIHTVSIVSENNSWGTLFLRFTKFISYFPPRLIAINEFVISTLSEYQIESHKLIKLT
jgi:hypothetical protein